MMLAVLPKRNLDDISGEIFVKAYARMLGHLSNAQLSLVTEIVIARCKWMPTIAECLEIARDYPAKDSRIARYRLASRIARDEEDARRQDQKDRELAAHYDQVRACLADGTRPDLPVMGLRSYPSDIIERAIAAGVMVEHETFGLVLCRSLETMVKVSTAAEPACRKCQDVGRVLNLEGDEIDCVCAR